MCLISFHWQPASQTPLVMVANRDEFHKRPTQASRFWPDLPHIIAGQDLEAGGTWMGATLDGRFAALTNVRQVPSPFKINEQDKISRGRLVLDYLADLQSPEKYLASVQEIAHLCEGFNLVVGNREQCWYLGNRNDQGPTALKPGLYGLSNAQLDSPWPKAIYAKQSLQDWLDQPNSPLYQALQRKAPYAQHELPSTGISIALETLLSSPFIVTPDYGTRATTALQLHRDSIKWQEVSYDSKGQQTQLVEHSF